MKASHGGRGENAQAWTKAEAPAKGTLYIVATPIGNLEDITLRALRVLKEVDLIAAEGPEHTKKLCSRFDIHTRISSYNQNNRDRKGPQLLAQLDSGKSIALVTNAGTPGISDPGVLLVDQALDRGVAVCAVPGPCAAIAALSICGLRTDGFLFAGFLSTRSGRRRKELEGLIHETRTLVFYEAPRRIAAMLADIEAVLGDRQAAITREMTKIHEQVLRGSLSELAARVSEDDGGARGEITVLVEGLTRDHPRVDDEIEEEVKKLCVELILMGEMSLVDIAKKLSLEHGMSYRHTYKTCLSVKASLERN